MISWEDRQKEILLEGRTVLERTSQSLVRSERAALEAESIGAGVVSELGQQRETLLRASNRLSEVDQNLSLSQSVLNTMTRRIFTNKLLLILIIISESGILAALIYIKFLK